LKRDYQQAFARMKAVIHRWDPYGLLGMGAPEDEFDSEIITLVRQLDRIQSASDAAEAISRVFT
jgi:hypothetical protein